MTWLNHGAGAVLIVLALLSGCKANDSNPASPSGVDDARVMIIQASPDAPAVDLFVDGALLAASLTFPNNTGYHSFSPGSHSFQVIETGTSTILLSAVPTLDADAVYSVFAVDSLSRIGAILLRDTLTAPSAGMANVRFVHCSPNGPAVDVAVSGGAVLFGDKVFKEYTAFAPLAAGTYNLEFRQAGTSSVILPIPGITFTAGKIYTIFAKGFVGGVGDQALGTQIIVNN